LAAKIIGVPSGLVTRVTEKELEVFLTSETAGNIFSKEMKFTLGTGIYCEHVIGTRKQNIVPNALKEDYWKENPSVPFNIISYMGVPIFWPDGEVFGTFCMLDNKENHYSELFNELLNSLKEIIQNDLNSLLMYQKAKNDLINKETQLKEIHHRVKNHFNLLISTLHLQSSLGKGEMNFESALGDIQSRISAISVIHDRLYHSMNLEHVSLGDYLKELGKHIISLISSSEIEFECNYKTVMVDAKVSVPCGLILNELITNSLKYAFNENSKPKFQLKLIPPILTKL
jgi:c-di-GMP phosphodiesterase